MDKLKTYGFGIHGCIDGVWNFNLLVNPRRACAARVTVVGSVCLSVRLSVNRNLTSGASVRPEKDITCSSGNEGQKFVWISLKPLRCRDTRLDKEQLV